MHIGQAGFLEEKHETLEHRALLKLVCGNAHHDLASVAAPHAMARARGVRPLYLAVEDIVPPEGLRDKLLTGQAVEHGNDDRVRTYLVPGVLDGPVKGRALDGENEKFGRLLGLFVRRHEMKVLALVVEENAFLFIGLLAFPVGHEGQFDVLEGLGKEIAVHDAQGAHADDGHPPYLLNHGDGTVPCSRMRLLVSEASDNGGDFLHIADNGHTVAFVTLERQESFHAVFRFQDIMIGILPLNLGIAHGLCRAPGHLIGRHLHAEDGHHDAGLIVF